MSVQHTDMFVDFVIEAINMNLFVEAKIIQNPKLVMQYPTVLLFLMPCNCNDIVDTFDNSCTVSDYSFERSVCIDHHVYDKLSDTWVKQKSKSQPFINIVAKVSPDDYSALGFRLNQKRATSVVLPAMADTGCQSCLAGLKVVHRLTLRESDLIPVTMKMHTATNLGIKILGATVLRLSAAGPDGQTLETRQMTYITDAWDKLFVSREACTTLGIIQETTPKIGMQSLSLPNMNSAIHEQPATCGCPKHTAPPPPPSTMPCPGTEENLPPLKSYLLY